MARAIFLTLEMRALKQRIGDIAAERRNVVTDLHQGMDGDKGLSMRAIGAELGISGPRVHEIIRGKADLAWPAEAARE